MLQIQNISKRYKTGDLVQIALDDVSLNFRDNEFVSILGPSGSGKTTLLNIIGGLDRYDQGDLIINGISTKKYKDRDWDSYRNHTIGFVFQSYNLIPHQSVLSNVELALTISGISKRERKRRAKEALEKVGLGNQLHKRPNQMSGGQMQRVAIARALVNDPDILLADEPTGALDTETSVQVMELLKEVAKDRLVIMVTHNPELAENYSSRIVKLRDGKIIDDSDPYEIIPKNLSLPQHKNMGKSSMSFFTSLSLSFNNLRTKKGRTLLTSFAGSIGIIGIALILSLSNGVNTYIEDIQKDTMSSYPITIDEQSIDLSSIIDSGSAMRRSKTEDLDHELDKVYSNGSGLEMANKMSVSITENNLTDFKKYLDNPDSEIQQYLGENGVVYSYDVPFDVYAFDDNGVLVNTDGSTFSDEKNEITQMTASSDMRAVSQSGMQSMMGGSSSSNVFKEMMPGKDSESISSVITDNYDIIYGEWPSNYDEVVLILDENNEVSLSTLYAFGILPSEEYQDLMEKVESEEDFKAESYDWSYRDICKKTFYLVPNCDYYVKNKKNVFYSIEEDEEQLEELVKNSVKLKITGIIRPAEGTDNTILTGTVGYTKALTDYMIDYAKESSVVKAQEKNSDKNILNNMKFEPKNEKEKIKDTKTYISQMGVSDKAKLWSGIASTTLKDNPKQLQMLQQMSEEQLAKQMDEQLEQLDSDLLLSIYDKYIEVGNYDDNMKKFGFVSLDAPSSISIYADSFEDKDAISQCIENYNKTVEEENQIVYTDLIELLTSSVTTIINVISYVLIAFVAVSLVVSSLMIGIITYISVLERTKEIGILRAIGASKQNISQVFNAETFIIGLCAGLIGVGISCLLLIPGNAIIHSVIGNNDVNASLPIFYAVILVVLSVLLTLIGGLLPSKKAAKKDPVAALRSE